MTTPDWPLHEAPEGFRAAWVIDSVWRSCEPGKRCRMNARYLLCDRPAVAEFPRSNGWWQYCDQHLYGRRFWNNAVWTERLFPVAAAIQAGALTPPEAPTGAEGVSKERAVLATRSAEKSDK